MQPDDLISRLLKDLIDHPSGNLRVGFGLRAKGFGPSALPKVQKPIGRVSGITRPGWFLAVVQVRQVDTP